LPLPEDDDGMFAIFKPPFCGVCYYVMRDA